ncbi:hypothetical protein [Bosea sp. BH3]|uniref:hypothetical protein n=1 Tax=Bosea sp. BH3 TaxID=2871701 RepID=UPI0021CB8371|nr:hypothetical protein [Bosea sp. BH3]MCU4182245.1 hypothetical protein [Bosea sp. BH3]
MKAGKNAGKGASRPAPKIQVKPGRPVKVATTETFSSFVRNLGRLENERAVGSKGGDGREGGR